MLIGDLEAPNTSYMVETKILSEPPNSNLKIIILTKMFKELDINQTNMLMLLSDDSPYIVKSPNSAFPSLLI